MEGYLSAFAGAYGLKTCALRFSNIFGPRSYHKGSVVAHFFRRLLAAEELVVYGDGSQARDFLFVDDLVQGIRQALEVGATGIYQLGSGRPTTINELLSAIREVMNLGSLQVRYVDFRKGEIHTTWCDITKARRELNFHPRTSLTHGLAETWSWFKQNSTQEIESPPARRRAGRSA
jgi:UDP-glucose 4-epimerase